MISRSLKNATGSVRQENGDHDSGSSASLSCRHFCTRPIRPIKLTIPLDFRMRLFRLNVAFNESDVIPVDAFQFGQSFPLIDLLPAAP